MLPAAHQPQSQPQSLQQALGEPLVEWRRPERVGEALHRQAAAALAKWPERYAPADDKAKLEWLTKLGLLVAGTLLPADAKAKAAALIDVLDHPIGCFSKASLKRAAKRFKFWPSYAELSELLDAELHRQRTFELRLRAIIAPPPPLPKPTPGRRWADLSDEEKAAHENLIADRFDAAAAKADATAVSEREPSLRNAYFRVAASIAAKRQQNSDAGQR